MIYFLWQIKHFTTVFVNKKCNFVIDYQRFYEKGEEMKKMSKKTGMQPGSLIYTGRKKSSRVKST
jgi:hypothetical protein